MKKPFLFLAIFCCATLQFTTIFAQNDSIGDYSDEVIRDSFELSLESYNKILINSDFAPISADNALVTSNNTVWISYEYPQPEEDENDEDGMISVGLAPKTILDQYQPSSFSALGTSISGYDFDDNGTLVGSYSIPPDPSGAVGTSHVGHVVNVGISFHTKAGTQLAGYPKSLRTFFAPLSPTTNTFDPKILWDQYENRWVIVTLEKTSTISRLLIAVSATADPEGTWHYQAINAVDGSCWFDYPGFAIDDKVIYITGNYFNLSTNSYCNSQIVIIDKGVSGGIYAGVTSLNESLATNTNFNIYNPSVLAGAGNAVGNMPAHTFGTRSSSAGTYLVGYSGLASGTTAFLQTFTITNPLSATPTFTQNYIAMGDVDSQSSFSNASQLGNVNKIETNDRRTLDAVWRDNKLWTVTTVSGSGTENGQETALWVRLNASGTTPTFDVAGKIGGEDISTGTVTWMGSIAVNSSGDAAVGFSASSATMYAGMYATLIEGASGTTGPSMLMKAGTDDYFRNFGGSSNRWGDYSATVLDPVNENFWVINEAAIIAGTPTSGGQIGRWQVFIQEIEAASTCMTDYLVTAPSLTSGTFEASNSITTQTGSTIAVNSGSNVTLKAGTFVQLNNGFHAKAGSIFKAEIGPCSTPFTITDPTEFATQSRSADIAFATATPERLAMVVYPNPSSGQMMIQYNLPKAGNVFMGLYSPSGKQVSVLINGEKQPEGFHQFSFNGANFPDGFYIISIRTEKELLHKKVLISKS